MSQKWIYKPEPDEEIVDGLISSIGFGTLESKILVMREIDNYRGNSSNQTEPTFTILF